MKKIVRVAIYIRVSTDKQANFQGKRIEDGSPEIQKNRAVEYVKNICHQINYDYQINYVIEDTQSAKNMNRKGFQQLFRLVDDREIDWIVTSEISRLNREMDDFIFFRKHCKDNKVEVLYVGAVYGKKDASAEMMENIMASYADYERKLTSMRLKRNIISRLTNDGKINGAEAILGLDKDPFKKGHFLVNHKEVQNLERLLEIYLSSSGPAETLRIANSLGVNDKNELPLTAIRFKNILKNIEWRYSGRWYLKDEETLETSVIQLKHGPLLSEEFVERIKFKNDSLAKKNIKCGRNDFTYLLSGLLRGPNGEKFSGQIGHGRNNDYRYYYSKSLKQRLNTLEVEDLIEKRVIKYFNVSDSFQKIVNNGFRDRDSRVKDLKKDISNKRLSLTNTDSRIETVLTHMTNTSINDSGVNTLIEKLNELQSIKTNLLAEISTKEALVIQYLETNNLTDSKEKIMKYALEFKNLKKLQKRELLETIFEKIEVMDAYCLKLHLKRPTNWGDSALVLKNGCDTYISGGTNRT